MGVEDTVKIVEQGIEGVEGGAFGAGGELENGRQGGRKCLKIKARSRAFPAAKGGSSIRKGLFRFLPREEFFGHFLNDGDGLGGDGIGW